MPRKNTSLAELLLQAPWWLSVVLAAIVYVLMALVLPYIETTNPIINTFFKALALPAPYFAFFILLIAPFAFFNARRKSKQLDRQSDIESIRRLHWRNFEELVAEAYRRKGYKVIEGDYGADGGIDLELVGNTEYVLVQCKQWKSQKVGVNVVREMFGVLSASKADRVVVICSGHFTQDAIKFAHDKPIELLDGSALLDLIRDVQKEPMVHEPTTKICPKCGGDLVQRIAKRGSNSGNKFLGCSSFPKCRHTQALE